ncbi:MAG TPA: S24 family peptidase, partial [Thermoanaerobaculia bacterium]|nr:S24 family peptidase [Thermoanaerobaculia bacterium]
ERLGAAIKAARKTQAQVASEIGKDRSVVSDIVRGANTNPGYQLLLQLAAAANTTLGALNGESIQLSSEDDETLTQFRDWIDSKLATIDALAEPNARILTDQEWVEAEQRVADRKSGRPSKGAVPFGANTALRAVGHSMTAAGIVAGDTVYAMRSSDLDTTALGKIIAFRLGEHVFIKTLTSHRGRHFLRSANPRYRAIEVAPQDPNFVILGIIVGRIGRFD